MKLAKSLKSVGAVMLTLAMLVGMMSVCGTFSFAASAESESTAQKFVADFSELKGILDANSVGWNQSDSYDTAYTPISDTTSVDGQLNTWMREKFASKTAHFYSSTRAWFAQHSNEISDLETAVNWRNYASFDVGNGSLRYKLGGGGTVGQMLRRVDTMIPQYSGTAVKLKNFEAKLTLKIGLPSFRGGFLFSFHEDEAGTMRMRSDGVYNGYRYYVTGSTLVIGNGMGNTMTPGKDGWVFYNDQNEISATTVDENVIANNATAAGYELKLANLGGKATYERFDRTLNDQNYTLTVRVVNGTATFTLESADGAFKKTMTSACDTTDGYLSFGVSNRDTNFYALEITELDDNGEAVDYGTYHSGGKAVEIFEADFTDVPDAHYVSNKYLYNANHDAATGKDKGLTTENNASTVSAVGAFTSGNNYTVDVRDKALVDYLESKFDFYTYGYNGGAGTLPMWNAAGYVVDAEGNPLGSGFASSNPYNPATGETANGNLPGSGQGDNGNGALYPTLMVYENKWLHIAKDLNNWSRDPFAVVYSYALNDANGDKAVLKNFQLDLDFKLTTASATTFPQNQSPVFVKFGGYDTVKHGDTDGAMFSISCNGEYFLDDLNTPVNGSTFTATKDTDNAPYYTETAGVAIREAHLTLTVKNGTVRAVVTLADGTTALDVTKDDIAIQNGLIYIGTTYAGILHGLPYFGAVKVVRLDDKGNPIDFTDGDEGTFDASFVGLTDVVEGNYYRNLGTKGNAIMTGKSTPWLSNKTAVGSGYAFSGDDTNVVNYLNEKFEFYHTDLTGKVHEMPTPYTTTEELQADKWAPTAGRWILFNGNRLRASLGTANGELFRKSLTVVPKIQGEAVYAADFEMEFDYSIESVRNGIYYPGGVALNFHSAEKAKTKDNAESVTLVFTREKMVLYDNEAPDYKYDDVQADEGALLWNNNNTNVGAAKVKINVVGNNMSLKVTSADGVAELYSNDNITLSRTTAGYVYLTALNSDVSLGDITIDAELVDAHTCEFTTPKFDANGHWNECTCGEKDEVIPHTLQPGYTNEGHADACVCGYITNAAAHELSYVVDGDKHYQACDCGYTTEKADHDFADGDCVCGAQKPNTAKVEKVNGEYIITVKPADGYELKAGSLLVKDANGNYFVPERVGYRDGGNASQYKVPAAAGDNFTLPSNEELFYQPTGDNLNMDIVGVSTTENSNGGLRFVYRLNITEEGGKLYMLKDGEKVEVAEYGLLLAAEAILKNPEDLDIETAGDSMHVHQFAWPKADKYFDKCAEYVDISVHVVNILSNNGAKMNLISRAYVKLANGDVVYTDAFVGNYNEYAG